MLLSSLRPHERAELDYLLDPEHVPEPFHMWLRRRFPKMIWDRPHQLMVYDALQRLDDGDYNKLIILMPPQHGKSTMVTERYSAWRMRTYAALRAMVISYNLELSRDFADNIRTIMIDDGELSPERGARADFKIKNGSHLRAYGMLTGITGRPAEWVVIDDPIKGPEDADSITFRDKVWKTYQNSITTRLNPGWKMCLIQCLAAGSRVAMEYGWKPIEDVKPGDIVWSYPVGSTKPEKRTVKALIPQPHAKTYTIRTDRNELRATGRHPFLVARGGVKFQRGERGFPENTGGHRNKWSFEWVQAQDLEPGDTVATLKSLPHGCKKKMPGRKYYLNKEDMWLMGFLWGDGWVTRHRRKNQNGVSSYAVCAAKGVYEDLNERVQNAMERLFGRRPYLTSGRYYRLDSNDAGRELEALGLTPGVRAPQKRLPEWLFHCRASEQRSFLRGIVDADGCKYKRGGKDTYVFASSSKGLVEDVRELAMTCGVRPTNLHHNALKDVQPPNSPKAFDTEFWSIYLAFKPWNAERKTVFGNQPAYRYIRLDRVKSVELNPIAEPVYDLALDGEDENFIANGFVVHNTRWHLDDLAGRLMENEPGEWEVLHLPALAMENDPLDREVGEALWEWRKTAADLEIEKERNPRGFWALYQGMPQPDGGAIFLPEWWEDGRNRFDIDDRGTRNRAIARFQAWDTAEEVGENNAYTACITFDLMPDYTLNLREVWRKRLTVPELLPAVVNQFYKHNQDGKLQKVTIESASSGRGLLQSLRAYGSPEIVRVLNGFSPVGEGSKEDRARNSAAPACANGLVRLPFPSESCPWLHDFETELFNFPQSKFKDQVDAFVMAIRVLIEKLQQAMALRRIRHE